MDNEIIALQQQIAALKSQLSEARRKSAPEPVADYELTGWDGQPHHVSDLFGDRDDLIVIHNMGRDCVYCTMWADGFKGMMPQLENRAAFVVVSPDGPAVQKAFAQSRNWSFPMYSGAGSNFIQDMGYAIDDGYMPGVSAFQREANGSIVRTGNDFFGLGDDYCPPWAFFDLLQNGADGWEPKYRY